MTDIGLFLFGAIFALSMKVLIAFLDALIAMFEKDKEEAKNDARKDIK